MPIILKNIKNLFSKGDVERLWHETIAYTKHADDNVTIKVVSEEEIRQLNTEYRGKDMPTNVLTFSYGDEHDIALCWAVAEREASERGADIRGYTALVVVHAFLHVVGMDHERSDEEATKTHKAEKVILAKAGFAPLVL